MKAECPDLALDNLLTITPEHSCNGRSIVRTRLGLARTSLTASDNLCGLSSIRATQLTSNYRLYLKETMAIPRSILFITSCPLPWGGSEELWSGAALKLLARGHRILVGGSENIPSRRFHKRWQHLRNAGIKINRFGVHPLERSVVDAVLRFKPRYHRHVSWLRNLVITARLQRRRVDLVVIAQGQAYDGCVPVPLPEICEKAGIPYVLICQKAAEIHWPHDGALAALRRSYRQALHSYFVSHHNLRLVEQQLGMQLNSTTIVRNPFLVDHASPLPWPDVPSPSCRLACVGRLWPEEKGQDVILNVLAMPKWRSRPLHVSFYGEGSMGKGLRDMARYLDLQQVSFPGFEAPKEIWRTHHGLILPCRAEGLPLAQIEAMLCGRLVVVADAGGTAEVLRDGEHGFLARSACISEIDAALERAWQRRDEWQDIGVAAADHVRSLFPADPCSTFADHLESTLNQLPNRSINQAIIAETT